MYLPTSISSRSSERIGRCLPRYEIWEKTMNANSRDSHPSHNIPRHEEKETFQFIILVFEE